MRLTPARGRVLDHDMVTWINHLLHETTWEPDRQAAADLLITIQYLMENEGLLPSSPIVPPGMAAPQALDPHGRPLDARPPIGAKPQPKRPKLRLVPREPAPTPDLPDKEPA